MQKTGKTGMIRKNLSNQPSPFQTFFQSHFKPIFSFFTFCQSTCKSISDLNGLAHVLAPIAGWFFLAISLLVWRYGERRYQSTGS